MTDQERREEAAEGELLNDLLNAAETPAAPAAAVAEEAGPTAAAQPTPEPEAAAPADEAPHAAEAADGADETTPEAPEAPAADATAEAPAADATEQEGASFTPVAEAEGDRPRRLKDLEVGMELDGRVTSIALYGIFVDIGVGRDGLVHISEMSDTRIDSPSDVVQINDTVKVRIKSIDPDARRISLTMRSQGQRERGRGGRGASSGGGGGGKRAEVDHERLASLVELLANDKSNATVEGVITGYAPFGAFADIGVGKDGLIHISELSETRVEKPEDAVKIGDRYTFKLLEVDPEGTRISLSLRRAQRTQKLQQLEPGQVIDGTVSGIAPFGAFVDIGVGRDGLVHISALSENRVAKVEDVVKVGDKVKVKVLEVDPQSKRISLTMRLEEPKAVEETPAASAVVPRTGPAAAPRFANVTAREEGRREERREDRRGGRGGRGERGERRGPAQQPVLETYSTDSEPEQEFEGDATLEDLLSKFGSSAGGRRDRDRRRDYEEDDEERYSRRQRDAIKRTLQQVSKDE